jgi:hypothetical protein
VKKRDSWTVGREPPFREDLSAEAEESPLLEAVTRKRLVLQDSYSWFRVPSELMTKSEFVLNWGLFNDRGCLATSDPRVLSPI